MRRLSHPNILGLYQAEESVAYPRKCGKGTVECVMLVLERAAGGELFDYLMHTGPFEEILARTYFRSLLAALELCHGQGVFHRDLKPENLLLDAQFGLKLADFGLAAVVTDPDTLCGTECGTRSYMSPEVMGRAPYDGAKADAWSAGVVLFILLAGNPPFAQATQNDWWFRACSAGRHDKFWAAHLRSAPHFPPQCQDLLNQIFVVSPGKRAGVDDLWDHPWLQGPCLDPGQLRGAMEERFKAQAHAKERELRAAKAKKARTAAAGFDPYAQNVCRSVLSGDAQPESTSLIEATEGSFAFVLTGAPVSEALAAAARVCGDLGAHRLKLVPGGDAKGPPGTCSGASLKASLKWPPPNSSPGAEFATGGAESIDESIDEELPPAGVPVAVATVDLAVSVTSSARGDGAVRVDFERRGGDPLTFLALYTKHLAPAVAALGDDQLPAEAPLLQNAQDDVF